MGWPPHIERVRVAHVGVLRRAVAGHLPRERHAQRRPTRRRVGAVESHALDHRRRVRRPWRQVEAPRRWRERQPPTARRAARTVPHAGRERLRSRLVGVQRRVHRPAALADACR
eukprot:951175-Prymnesium_polylepis.1